MTRCLHFCKHIITISLWDYKITRSFCLYRLESSFRSFSRPVLHAAARVVQEMGKSRAAAFALGLQDIDEGAEVNNYSDNNDSYDPDINPTAPSEGSGCVICTYPGHNVYYVFSKVSSWLLYRLKLLYRWPRILPFTSILQVQNHACCYVLELSNSL